MFKGQKSKIFVVTFLGFIVLVIAFSFLYFSSKQKSQALLPEEERPAIVPEEKVVPPTPDPNNLRGIPTKGTIVRPIPPPVSMDRMKKEGCVTDGLLTAYNPENDKFVDLINRSNCYYMHRAIETWLTPPDFHKIRTVMDQITKKEVVYGMFLAEAIDEKAWYKNNQTGRKFDFPEMCKKGSDNIWGEHTCKPAFSSLEYRHYLKYITRKAMDLGVQSFMFGQIYMQEGESKIYAPRIVKDMRSYAEKKGLNIVIGAQTGAIQDEKYLKLFDYIEGGVGIDSTGNVESGPCLSRKTSCWGLLWNKTYASKANNVFLHLDWTGVVYDDLDVFARMTPETRAATLQKLYAYFTKKNMGFLMPYFGVLYKDNNGCYGPKKRFYSPDNSYSCKDEGVIDGILKTQK